MKYVIPNYKWFFKICFSKTFIMIILPFQLTKDFFKNLKS